MTPEAAFAALPEEGRQVVLHAARYGLTTSAVVHRWLWPHLSPDAVRKALGRLAERCWLARHLLHDREPYYVPGRSALWALGLRRSTKPLGHQALLEHYAVLLAGARRGCDVFTEREFRDRFPDLTAPGFSAKNHFLDRTTDPPRIGCLVVDHDKLSARMVKKLGRRVGKVFDAAPAGLRRLVFGGGYAFHVVTATQGKCENLRAAFARKPLRNVPVLVECYPDELGDFFLAKRR